MIFIECNFTRSQIITLLLYPDYFTLLMEVRVHVMIEAGLRSEDGSNSWRLLRGEGGITDWHAGAHTTTPRTQPTLLSGCIKMSMIVG